MAQRRSRRVSSSSLYLDTSCLLKLFFSEPESTEVAKLIASEARVVVSELGLIEASVQIQGRRASGSLPRARAQRLEEALGTTLSMKPFEVVPFAPATLARARDQARSAQKGAQCRTLDRLHLAVMELEGLSRLLTNDGRQATAARSLGFEVVGNLAANW
jgi:predicted nucleic acid-binding protein